MKTMRDIAGLFCAVSIIGLVCNLDYASQLEQEAEEKLARSSRMTLSYRAKHLSSMVAACMRGEQFIWQDPHTKSDFAAFCDVQELGKVGH